MLPLSSQKYEQNRDMSLRITVITLRDLGPYTCQAYNGLGRATSNTVTLYAVGPVTVTTPRDRDYLPYLVEQPSMVATTPRPHLTYPTTQYPSYTARPAPPQGTLRVLVFCPYVLLFLLLADFVFSSNIDAFNYITVCVFILLQIIIYLQTHVFFFLLRSYFNS